MRQKNYLIILLLLNFLISACRTQESPDPASLEQTTQPEATDPVLLENTQPPTDLPATPTSQPLPTATTDLRNVTDNPEVNATITALLDKDIETLMDALMLNSQPCTTQDGLGGPPKCPQGINDGTVLSFFPVLGPGEGSQLTPDEVSRVFDYEQPDLFAVMLVKPPEYSDPSFPPGTYAVILDTEPMGFARTFRLNQQGEIVRVDYTAWPAEQEVQNIEGNLLYQQ
jgi:hypothetical protein